MGDQIKGSGFRGTLGSAWLSHCWTKPKVPGSAEPWVPPGPFTTGPNQRFRVPRNVRFRLVLSLLDQIKGSGFRGTLGSAWSSHYWTKSKVPGSAEPWIPFGLLTVGLNQRFPV